MVGRREQRDAGASSPPGECDPEARADDVPAAGHDRRRTRRLPRRRRMLAGGAGLLVLTIGAGWLGLQVEPSPMPAVALTAGPVLRTSLPVDLPEPVERFYRTLYGDTVPVVDSAVVSGRGTMRISGVTLPVRYRFSHHSGQAYRHYIEATVYGAGLLEVNEWYVDGRARLELPFGTSEGTQVDQGANLALWAEGVWMPSIWVTDDRVRWEPVDGSTARLRVPFGSAYEEFTVTFDGSTGLLQRMESLRFKGQGASAKTPWVNEVREWGELDGSPVPLVTAVRWGDEGSAWAVLRTEDVLRNADVRTYLQQAGP